MSLARNMHDSEFTSFLNKSILTQLKAYCQSLRNLNFISHFKTRRQDRMVKSAELIGMYMREKVHQRFKTYEQNYNSQLEALADAIE